jgi:pimeloyl-ACP methyl ester carboxylesterase
VNGASLSRRTGGVYLERLVTADSVVLHGLDSGVQSEVCVVHVHGKCGNFFANPFVAEMAIAYAEFGVRFMSFNHRGHDCLVENVAPSGEVSYHGGSVSTVDDIRRDVSTIMNHASSVAGRVVIQGHSQGCEMAFTHVLRESDSECILLSPSDSALLQRNWRGGESVSDQISRLRLMEPGAWLEPEEYGVWGILPYPIPVTAGSLLSVLESQEFWAFDFSRPWAGSQADCRCFAYVGGSDPLALYPVPHLEECLSQRFRKVVVSAPPKGDHVLTGLAGPVVREVVDWLAEC